MNDQKYAAELVRRAKLISSARVANPEVTDRAHRYRAQKNVDAPKACAWCGSRSKKLMVAHKDGNESNDRKSNLAWSCRSCNAIEAARHKASGLGRRTKQYNPKKAGKAKGAPNSGAWFQALETRHGRGDGSMTLEQAIEMIHDTPFATRQKYNALGTKAHQGRVKARQDDMPDWAR